VEAVEAEQVINFLAMGLLAALMERQAGKVLMYHFVVLP
jgi:hypothetical protein